MCAMKNERIIIAAMVCVAAVVCCWIVSRTNHWQYIKYDGGLVIFDRENGISYRAIMDGKDRAKYVREHREQ